MLAAFHKLKKREGLNADCLLTTAATHSLSERALADRGNSRCHGVTPYSALQWHNLWRHTLDVSSDIHPRYSLKENECTSPKFQLNTNTVTIGGVTVHTTWIFEVYIAMANSFVPTRGLVCLITVPIYYFDPVLNEILAGLYYPVLNLRLYVLPIYFSLFLLILFFSFFMVLIRVC